MAEAPSAEETVAAAETPTLQETVAEVTPTPEEAAETESKVDEAEG